MNDFLCFFCIFMNDFGVNRHTFMNDFGVLFHQNARIFLVIPLCQRSPFVASRRFMCHRHVVNVIYVVCRRATLVLLLCWLVILGEHRRELNRWGVAYFLSSFLRRRDIEPLVKEQACLSHLFVIIHPHYRLGSELVVITITYLRGIFRLCLRLLHFSSAYSHDDGCHSSKQEHHPWFTHWGLGAWYTTFRERWESILFGTNLLHSFSALNGSRSIVRECCRYRGCITT